MVEIFGWSSTLLLTICALPQLFKIYRTNSVEDVSIWMWWVYLIGHLFAIVYAILIFQPPLLFKYSVNILISIFIIILYY